MSFKEISEHLQIATSTAHRIYKRFELTGDVEPMKPRKRYECRKLDAQNPCLYLHEMCREIEEATGLQVAGSTVCRVLRKNGYTVQTIAKQRSVEYRQGTYITIYCRLLCVG